MYQLLTVILAMFETNYSNDGKQKNTSAGSVARLSLLTLCSLAQMTNRSGVTRGSKEGQVSIINHRELSILYETVFSTDKQSMCDLCVVLALPTAYPAESIWRKLIS